MARPRKNPVERFSDILPLWSAAELRGGILFTAPSPNTAANIVYRLNQYRKIVRENSDREHTSLDTYVIRRNGAVIEIAPRPTFDLSTMTTLDGRPIDTLIEAPKPLPYQFDPKNIQPPTAEEQKILDQVKAAAYRGGMKLE
jgi:hypothetical protein